MYTTFLDGYCSTVQGGNVTARTAKRSHVRTSLHMHSAHGQPVHHRFCVPFHIPSEDSPCVVQQHTYCTLDSAHGQPQNPRFTVSVFPFTFKVIALLLKSFNLLFCSDTLVFSSDTLVHSYNLRTCKLNGTLAACNAGVSAASFPPCVLCALGCCRVL